MIIENQNLVKEFAYNENSKELNVTFRNNKQYSYDNVPKNVIDNLEMAPSMDKFYENNIQNQYEAKKTGDADQMLCS